MAHLNSPMMVSRSFCGMSPCMALTVKLFCRIFSVSQSTFRLVLQKMTAYDQKCILGQDTINISSTLLKVTSNNCDRNMLWTVT